MVRRGDRRARLVLRRVAWWRLVRAVRIQTDQDSENIPEYSVNLRVFRDS